MWDRLYGSKYAAGTNNRQPGWLQEWDSKYRARVDALPFLAPDQAKKAKINIIYLPSSPMASKPPPSPTPRRRPKAADTSTAAQGTGDVSSATLPAAGVDSPVRVASLFASAQKRGKPVTTPERGCESPQKKSIRRGKTASANRVVQFEPAIVTDSSRGPSPVSVDVPPSSTSANKKKQKQYKKNARNVVVRTGGGASSTETTSTPKPTAAPPNKQADNRSKI